MFRHLILALLLCARLGAEVSAFNGVPITTASNVMGVSPLSAVIGIAVVPSGPTLPAGINQLTLSATGAVKQFGGSVSLVECTSGTSVTITLYDHPYTNAGTAVYSVTLSSGQSASPSFSTINGIYAVITGGNFRLTLNNN